MFMKIGQLEWIAAVSNKNTLLSFEEWVLAWETRFMNEITKDKTAVGVRQENLQLLSDNGALKLQVTLKVEQLSRCNEKISRLTTRKNKDIALIDELRQKIKEVRISTPVNAGGFIAVIQGLQHEVTGFDKQVNLLKTRGDEDLVNIQRLCDGLKTEKALTHSLGIQISNDLNTINQLHSKNGDMAKANKNMAKQLESITTILGRYGQL